MLKIFYSIVKKSCEIYSINSEKFSFIKRLFFVLVLILTLYFLKFPILFDGIWFVEDKYVPPSHAVFDNNFYSSHLGDQ